MLVKAWPFPVSGKFRPVPVPLAVLKVPAGVTPLLDVKVVTPLRELNNARFPLPGSGV